MPLLIGVQFFVACEPALSGYSVSIRDIWIKMWYADLRL